MLFRNAYNIYQNQNLLAVQQFCLEMLELLYDKSIKPLYSSQRYNPGNIVSGLFSRISVEINLIWRNHFHRFDRQISKASITTSLKNFDAQKISSLYSGLRTLFWRRSNFSAWSPKSKVQACYLLQSHQFLLSGHKILISSRKLMKSFFLPVQGSLRLSFIWGCAEGFPNRSWKNQRWVIFFLSLIFNCLYGSLRKHLGSIVWLIIPDLLKETW